MHSCLGYVRLTMGQNRDELCTVDDYLYDMGIQRLLYEERNIASILCEKGRYLKMTEPLKSLKSSVKKQNVIDSDKS